MGSDLPEVVQHIVPGGSYMCWLCRCLPAAEKSFGKETRIAMPGATGGEWLYHRGSPGGLTTTSQCFAGTAWYPFTRIPPGGGFCCPPISSVNTVVRTGVAQKNHLHLHIEQHQRMLDYSRQDLQGLEHLMKDVMEVPGIDWEDLGLGRQCGGKHWCVIFIHLHWLGVEPLIHHHLMPICKFFANDGQQLCTVWIV